jgi:hypothetical protein
MVRQPDNPAKHGTDGHFSATCQVVAMGGAAWSK